MSKKYEILRPKEYSGRQIALPEEEFWELAKDLEDMKLEISTLEKENQELKEMESRALKHNSVLVGRLREQQDQFLKVVESVCEEHAIYTTKYSGDYIDKCTGCDWTDKTVAGNRNVLFEDHLLQEIKSAMEKGNNG